MVIGYKGDRLLQLKYLSANLIGFEKILPAHFFVMKIIHPACLFDHARLFVFGKNSSMHANSIMHGY